MEISFARGRSCHQESYCKLILRNPHPLLLVEISVPGSRVALGNRLIFLALPGCLGDNRAQLLGDLIGTAEAAFDFLAFPFSEAHDNGEFFSTFLANKFIGRHGCSSIT